MVRILLLDSLVLDLGLWFFFVNISKEKYFRLKDTSFMSESFSYSLIEIIVVYVTIMMLVYIGHASWLTPSFLNILRNILYLTLKKSKIYEIRNT